MQKEDNCLKESDWGNRIRLPVIATSWRQNAAGSLFPSNISNRKLITNYDKNGKKEADYGKKKLITVKRS